MGRNKITRSYSFKPKFKKFALIDGIKSGDALLSHEEIEAIFLMDYMGLYQEDAAKKMQVSRPTLSRIIKNARHKLSSALVCGLDIKITDEKDSIILAICTDDKKRFANITPHESFIVIYEIRNGTIIKTEIIDNLAAKKEAKTAAILPEVLSSYGVNYFISSQMGLGLKNSLLTKGIYSLIKDSFQPSDLSSSSFF